MIEARTSGVLMHVTSLPDGRLGRSAFEFVDWLAAAGQTWWQVLPLAPPDRHRSPYKARSAFAAWPGLLAAPRARVSAAERVAFRGREAYWVEDWMRFAPGRALDALDDQIRFDREWGKLRRYAFDRGVRLFGDVAIYVAPGSVDHRAHPSLFQAGAVAGAPPDAFSSSGQLWGNPLYDWPALRRTGYRWWVERLRRTLELFDLARLDHFRGFVAYWSVPEGDADARDGTWRRGPGRALFDAFDRTLGPPAGPAGGVSPGLSGRYSDRSAQGSPVRAVRSGLPLVAEDLGVITPAVERLRDGLGLPGMVVLQFGFDPNEPRSVHRLANHAENRVVYTGTHDHDTARGWYESLDDRIRAEVDAQLPDREEPHWGLIELALSSRARTAIVQVQDVLGLGSEARMNDPSRTGGNWRWRMESGALSSDLARRLREATEAAGRSGAGAQHG